MAIDWTISLGNILTTLGITGTVVGSIAAWVRNIDRRQIIAEIWIKNHGDQPIPVSHYQFEEHLKDCRVVEAKIEQVKSEIRQEVIRSFDQLSGRLESVHKSVHDLRNQIFEKFMNDKN